MKKLIYLIFIAILFTACSEPITVVENPEDITTFRLQQLEKDTVIISIDDKYLYVFDNAGKIVNYKTIQHSVDNIYVNNIVFVVLLIIMMFCIIIIIKLTSD